MHIIRLGLCYCIHLNIIQYSQVVILVFVRSLCGLVATICGAAFMLDAVSRLIVGLRLVRLEFNGPVNTINVISSQLVYLTKLISPLND